MKRSAFAASRRWSTMIVGGAVLWSTVAWAGCRRHEPVGATVARPVGPGWRASVLVPVVEVEGASYVPLEGWAPSAALDRARAAPAAWGPIEVIGDPGGGPLGLWRQSLRAGATEAGGLVDIPVAGYTATGRACRSIIVELTRLAYGDAVQGYAETDYLVGRLVHAPDCAPVVVTDRPRSQVFPPSDVAATQRSAAIAAFAALPAYRRLVAEVAEANQQIEDERAATAGEGDPNSGGSAPVEHDVDEAPSPYALAAPEVATFVGEDGRAYALVSATSRRFGRGCFLAGSELRALVALGATGPAVLVETEEPFGAPVLALLDSDRDGRFELVFGPASFDEGMAAGQSFGRVWDPSRLPGQDAPVDDLVFRHDAGCD